jgi:hypothetical protein
LDGEGLVWLEASSFRKRCQVCPPEGSALVRSENVGEELEAAVSSRADGVDDPRDGGWGLSTYLGKGEGESQPVVAVVSAQQIRPEAPRPVGWPRRALAVFVAIRDLAAPAAPREGWLRGLALRPAGTAGPPRSIGGRGHARCALARYSGQRASEQARDQLAHDRLGRPEHSPEIDLRFNQKTRRWGQLTRE